MANHRDDLDDETSAVGDEDGMGAPAGPGGEGGGEDDHEGEEDDGGDSDFKQLVQGTGGVDDLTGTDADERFILLAGNDTARGGGGDDAMIGGRDDDWLRGEAGNDEITGTEGTDVIFGGEGDDTLDGGGRAGNYVEGGEGADVIVGGEGADVIWGGPGADDITPGNGNDVLYIRPGDADGDTIRGFDASQDVLWLPGAALGGITQQTRYDPSTFDLVTELTIASAGSGQQETITLIGLGFPESEDPEVLLADFLARNVEQADRFAPDGPQESLDLGEAQLGFSQAEAEAGLEGGGGGGGDHGGGGGGDDGGDHGGGEAVDWNYLAGLATAFFKATGQWGTIEDWLPEAEAASVSAAPEPAMPGPAGATPQADWSGIG